MLLGKPINDGTYGVVYKVTNDKKEKLVVKRNIATQGTGISCLRELDTLYKFRKHPFIAKLTHFSYFDTPLKKGKFPAIDQKKYPYGKDDAVHFVFYRAMADLHEDIQDNLLTYENIKIYLYQILLAVNSLHQHNYIHLDLKPANVLIYPEDKTDKRSSTKDRQHTKAVICDLGECRPHWKEEKLCSYMVTHPYRAPEICLNEFIGPKVDIWSVGCIFYEMLFQSWIISENCSEITAGILTELKNLDFICPDLSFEQRKENMIKRLKKTFAGPEIKQLTKHLDSLDNIADLLVKLLSFKPEERLTAQESLTHQFFYHQQTEILSRQNSFLKVNLTEKKNTVKISKQEQKALFDITTDLFKYCDLIEWCNPRVLFHTVRLSKRYFCSDKKKNYHNELVIISCLYIAVKFFSYLGIPFSWQDFCQDLKSTQITMQFTLENFLEFEKFYLQTILKFKIYSDSLLETTFTNKTQQQKLLTEYIKM